MSNSWFVTLRFTATMAILLLVILVVPDSFGSAVPNGPICCP